MFALAERHGVALPHKDVAALRAAYAFHDLQSFLDLYYAGCAVLRDRSDFYALAMAYFARAHADGVVHAELFFDPQTHMVRKVDLQDVFGGLGDAIADAHRRYGISAELILCFLRHLSEDDAFATLRAARRFAGQFVGVGLDSGERGNPPAKFARVFAAARALGLRAVAHAGEEGPATYIWEALDVLGVERIDHGVRCEEDPRLVDRLIREHVPLTVCPLSNVRLRVVANLREHNLARLLRRGVAITIHSDDPAYFGGYLGDNYRAVAEALELTSEELVALASNAARASFLPAPAKEGGAAGQDPHGGCTVMIRYGVVLVALLAGCGRSVDKDVAEKLAKKALEKEQMKPTDVSCPEGVSVHVGGTFDCTALSGNKIDLVVHIKQVDHATSELSAEGGGGDYKLEATLDDGVASRGVFQRGVPGADVSKCPEAQKLDKVGDTATCDVTVQGAKKKATATRGDKGISVTVP